MRFKEKILLFVTVCYSSFYGLSQDTIEIKNRREFDKLIQYTFIEKTGGLNQNLRLKIEKEFRKFDFTEKKYECQYIFDYVIELDSLGFIDKCQQIGKFEDEILNKFSMRTIDLIKNSGLQIPNLVNLKDTSYFINTMQFTMVMSCDPRELIFNISKNENSNKKYVLTVKDGLEIIYFSGFENYLKKPKKCKKR